MRSLTVIVGLIAVAALFRLAPHPPNFAPVAALALFGGAFISNRLLAFAIPLAAMLVTDVVLGFHATMPFVYLAFIATVLIGRMLRTRRQRVLPVAAGALGASMLFFVVTNFGTWLVQDLYPATAAGLAACYTAAIPFFHNTVIANLLFTGMLFGLAALLRAGLAQPEEPLAAA